MGYKVSGPKSPTLTSFLGTRGSLNIGYLEPLGTSASHGRSRVAVPEILWMEGNDLPWLAGLVNPRFPSMGSLIKRGYKYRYRYRCRYRYGLGCSGDLISRLSNGPYDVVSCGFLRKLTGDTKWTY